MLPRGDVRDDLRVGHQTALLINAQRPRDKAISLDSAVLRWDKAAPEELTADEQGDQLVAWATRLGADVPPGLLEELSKLEGDETSG